MSSGSLGGLSPPIVAAAATAMRAIVEDAEREPGVARK